ncbi:hypothetical protein CGMCC3_g3218 [Colletotrichum fructicola]|nr:uncharacterized protein CGMCC3_g3218 [Colletotrichum fructicola]KAE9580925.1 hypothetical protein CGMCC3_g3218 [Colletotrichum fructicola]
MLGESVHHLASLRQDHRHYIETDVSHIPLTLLGVRYSRFCATARLVLLSAFCQRKKESIDVAKPVHPSQAKGRRKPWWKIPVSASEPCRLFSIPGSPRSPSLLLSLRLSPPLLSVWSAYGTHNITEALSSRLFSNRFPSALAHEELGTVHSTACASSGAVQDRGTLNSTAVRILCSALLVPH